MLCIPSSRRDILGPMTFSRAGESDSTSEWEDEDELEEWDDEDVDVDVDDDDLWIDDDDY